MLGYQKALKVHRYQIQALVLTPYVVLNDKSYLLLSHEALTV